MKVIGYIPADEDGNPIMMGERRFKFYASEALALSFCHRAKKAIPVYVGDPDA